jgi:uncharacterized membrane protein
LTEPPITEVSKTPWGTALRQSFVAGLLVMAPLGITLYVLWFVFDHVDAPLGDRINAVLQQTVGLDVHIPGLGILATLAVVLSVGWLTRIAVFRYLVRLVEQIIGRLPVVRSLYNASRQIVTPFTSHDALPFSEVGLVEYPMKGRYTIGMIARQRISEDPDDDRVVVFFPSNHLHLGYPVVMSRKDVQVIDMTIEQAVKFMVSCGVVADNHHFLARGVLSAEEVSDRVRQLAAAPVERSAR